MTGAGAPPLIDGEPFKEGYYNQSMDLGDSEQWMIINESTSMHRSYPREPIPISRNIRSGTMLEPKRLPTPWIWWDTMPLPRRAVTRTIEQPVKNGHVRIRHRFVDFPGSFVLHCHILAHEDRGMMQLVRCGQEDPYQHH